MSTTAKALWTAVSAAAVAALVAATPVAAQPAPGAGPGGGPGWGPGMMGPGMMMGPGGWGMGRGGMMCDPRGAGFAGWRIERLEQALKPTEAQKTALDELKAASPMAAEAVKAACPTEFAMTPTGRLEAMEKRLEAMLQAVKTVRPAFEKFYATLTDEQKARLNSVGPGRGWMWQRWRDR